MDMQTGTLVKEVLFTTKQGEIVERLGIVVKSPQESGFDGYVEVAWNTKPEHPVGNGEGVSLVLTEIDKLEIIAEPPTKGNE